MEVNLSLKLRHVWGISFILSFTSPFFIAHAQEPVQVKEELFQEVNEIFERAATEDLHVFAPKNFARADGMYQEALQSYERGVNRENIQMALFQVKTYLGMAFEAAKVVKAVLGEDLIALRSEALKLTQRESARNPFDVAEKAFHQAISAAEVENIRSARLSAQQAGAGYREAIILSLQEGPFKEAQSLLEEQEGNIPQEEYQHLLQNLSEAKELHAEVQSARNSNNQFLELFRQIMERLQQILALAAVEVQENNLPDLTIDVFIFHPENPSLNEDLELRAAVRNAGKGSAEMILVSFVANEDQEVGQSIIRYLEPGQTEEVTAITKVTEPGDWQITVRVDPENKIVESDEQNNEAHHRFGFEFPFIEEYPGWNMPELAVTGLSVEPERANLHDLISIHAIVANIGTGESSPARIIMAVDDQVISRAPVGQLEPGAEAEFTATWTATRSGRHLVRADVEFGEGHFDGSFSNNSRISVVRVSGEQNPVPELEFSEIDFDSFQFLPGESYEIPLQISNPGFADIRNIPIEFFIDGEPVSYGLIDYLPPGEEQEFQIPWSQATPGEHLLAIRMELPDEFQDARFLNFNSWYFLVPDRTFLNNLYQNNKWVSIGPSILDNNWVGRINDIAFNPKDHKIMYACGIAGDMSIAAAAGVWKTINGGGKWFPVGDRLPTMMIRTLAVDALYPDIVYAGSPKGIFKSLDGGKTWVTFATDKVITNVIELEVRNTKTEVIIYAGTDNGVMRYKGTDHRAKTSAALDWVNIRKGKVVDLAVHPSNHSILYVSIWNDGLYRTDKGINAKAETSAGSHDWKKLDHYSLPTTKNKSSIVLDIFKPNPDILYAGVTRPTINVNYGIYRSVNKGLTWKTVKEYADNELDGALYNPYIRVSPKLAPSSYQLGTGPTPWVVYFGGVRLYQLIENSVGGGETYQVPGAQFDMKGLEFDPAAPVSYYYSFGDQGIYHGELKIKPKQAVISGKNFGISGDICTPRNTDLRVTEFYDFDVSSSNSNLILGGTQDTGTILYEGSPKWRMVKGGDGLFSLINPKNNKIMYGQHQALNNPWGTARSDKGGAPGTWFHVAKSLPIGYGFTWAYIASDPCASDGVLAVGDGKYLYYTNTGGSKWSKHDLKPIVGKSGNVARNTVGDIIRVIVNPKTCDWIVGTTKGWLLLRPKNENKYYEIFHHPYGAQVRSMAVSPVDSKALYATFEIGGKYRNDRVWLIMIDPSDPLKSVPHNIGWHFPSNLTARVIAGDAHKYNVAYVGTEKGVQRWNGNVPSGLVAWQPYNDGLPLTTVVDLVVAPDKKLLAATKGRGAWCVVTSP